MCEPHVSPPETCHCLHHLDEASVRAAHCEWLGTSLCALVALHCACTSTNACAQEAPGGGTVAPRAAVYWCMWSEGSNNCSSYFRGRINKQRHIFSKTIHSVAGPSNPILLLRPDIRAILLANHWFCFLAVLVWLCQAVPVACLRALTASVRALPPTCPHRACWAHRASQRDALCGLS
jgi:hypothetical protein